MMIGEIEYLLHQHFTVDFVLSNVYNYSCNIAVFLFCVVFVLSILFTTIVVNNTQQKQQYNVDTTKYSISPSVCLTSYTL